MTLSASSLLTLIPSPASSGSRAEEQGGGGGGGVLPWGWGGWWEDQGVNEILSETKLNKSDYMLGKTKTNKLVSMLLSWPLCHQKKKTKNINSETCLFVAFPHTVNDWSKLSDGGHEPLFFIFFFSQLQKGKSKPWLCTHCTAHCEWIRPSIIDRCNALSFCLSSMVPM